MIGFLLDDELAAEIKATTQSEMSFLTAKGVVASSWAGAPRDELAAAARALLARGAAEAAGPQTSGRDDVLELAMAGEAYLSLLVPLAADGDLRALCLIQRSRAEVTGYLRTVRATVFAAGLLVLALAAGLSYLVAGQVSRSITALGWSLRAMASGDLTHRVEVRSTGELGWFEQTFGAMTDQLTGLLRPLQRAAGEVAGASEQIGAATRQLAAGAERQAHQTAEASGAIGRLADGVRLVYETSQKSRAVSDRAQEAVRRGVDTVQATLSEMLAIEASVGAGAAGVAGLESRSREIGQIVEVIKDLAAQTNLLALNAAIEAARAGEHGRGFEVVAEEIRKLAEKSAASTVKIGELIGEIQGETARAAAAMAAVVREVEAGSRQAGQTGEALKDLLAAVEETGRIIQVVAEASHEQRGASDRAAASMETISAVTRETAAGSEELAATAQGLGDLSQQLARLAARFRLEDESRAGPGPRA